MRIKDLSIDEMTGAQRRVAEEAASGKRGRVPGPLRVWLHSPEFGARAQRLGEFVRYDTVLGPKLSELAILVTASSIPSFHVTAKVSVNTRDCCSSSAYRSTRGLSLCSGMLGVRS
jgi:hypothetical protein